MWCKLHRAAFLALRRICLEVLVKACIHRLSSSGMVRHGGRRMVECEPVASEIGGVTVSMLVTEFNGIRESISRLRKSYNSGSVLPLPLASYYLYN